MVSANKRASRLDYCQYLLSSQINYTLTNFADHSQHYSHDQLNRFLRGDKLTPRLLWEQVKDSIVTSTDGYLLFDDTVADKNYSFAIELVRRQYRAVQICMYGATLKVVLSSVTAADAAGWFASCGYPVHS